MPDSLLSVIVPVYNTAPWLARCLDSICTQTYRNLEILCVNDGSTDNSAAILEEYAARDSRIKVITQKNAGLSAARNAGLEHATGAWVTGVDSDDWLDTETYSNAMKHAMPEVDMVWFGVHIEGDAPAEAYAGLAEYYRVKLEGVHEFDERVCRTMDVNFWNKIYRRELIERYGLRFPLGLLYEDIPFFHGYTSVAGRVACVPERYYHYLQRPGSIMGQSQQKTPRSVEHIDVIAWLADFWEQHGLLPRMRERVAYLINRYYWAAESHCTPDALPLLRQKTASFVKQLGVRKMLGFTTRWQLSNLAKCAWLSRLVSCQAHQWSLRILGRGVLTFDLRHRVIRVMGVCVWKKV